MSISRHFGRRRAYVLALCISLPSLFSLWYASVIGDLPITAWLESTISSGVVGAEHASYDHFVNSEQAALTLPSTKINASRPNICQDANVTAGRENATILILARNRNAHELARTLGNFESTFNARFRYPYTILNEASFSKDFQRIVLEALPEGAAVEFAGIPREHWGIPEWLDQKQVRKAFVDLEEAGVMYEGIESYHNMCRYFSGLFALHPALAKYRYYWRLEPGVHFNCKTPYDPFQYLRETKKVYGFNMALYETSNTIPSLFTNMTAWRGDRNRWEQDRPNDGIWNFFTEAREKQKQAPAQTGEQYNGCHFWTNFELGDLDLFRGEAYQSLFRHLENSGGFYFERWGDAPVRSLALGLLAERDQIHYFEDIAYQHWPYLHYPEDEALLCKCEAPPANMINSEYHNLALHKGETCVQKWKAL